MKRSHVCLLAFLALDLFFPAAAEPGREDWAFYGASLEREDAGETLKGWYGLNRKIPVSGETADILHFFDRDSVAASSPLPGSITRVWEKSVVQRETRNYQDTKRDVEGEQELLLERRITALDQAWIFPLVVKRATKETHTLFEINCGSGEFMILEVSHYDSEGERMTREVNMDRMDLWYPIEPGSVMEALSRQICKQ